MNRSGWRFAIDVGGTFTDCIGISPEGEVRVFKTLSSGRTKGVVQAAAGTQITSDARCLDPAGFWNGATIEFALHASSPLPAGEGPGVREPQPGKTDPLTAQVLSHDPATGALILDTPFDVPVGTPYDLITGDEAPILGIRHILGLAGGEPIPPCEVRLGTTRGTNALLERRGAEVGFVTTQGFGDLLLIGDQARPHLFELAIRKPAPLTHAVVEVPERLAADGTIRVPLDLEFARSQLAQLRSLGCESVAVALLHAYRNPVHELAIGELAHEAGFREVVLSHQVSPTIKIVPRAESTVLDAYLNPILREYVQRIEASLSLQTSCSPLPPGEGLGVRVCDQRIDSSPTSDLLLMTSSGGLVPATEFSGKESVLSGPAGGAVGFSTTASAAGFPRSIGFDMGGTSTDVSRFDGRFELETESRKAGIRIAAPTLAIETVAAGGGSICSFDGVKLTVGPASAGADPGPACYGRGGPLTITDCNLLLGRIVEERFPFPLDRPSAEARARELAERVEIATSQRLTPEQLAEGLIAIANSHMARAIRRISVARGYDPREYTLAVFGGAGAQHACELASELEMGTIVVHPLASVLSAYGIACASRTRHAGQTLLRPLDEQLDLEGVFGELVAEVDKRGEPPHPQPLSRGERGAGTEKDKRRSPKLLPPSPPGRGGEGSRPASRSHIERSLDLRYTGIESTITIPEPVGVVWTASDFAYAYEGAHEREFGFRRAGRSIEVVTARLLERDQVNDPPRIAAGHCWARSRNTQRVRVQGVWQEIPVWQRADHGATDVEGPALINEAMTTLFVDSGFRASIGEDGSIVVRKSFDVANTLNPGPSPGGRGETETADPIQLEIFNNLFASIAEQMGETLRRTSVSTNVKERLDYSCALFDGAGELIVNAPHIPVHLGAMGETVKRVLADNSDLSPGNVVLTNDPYRGGSHLPDLTVVTPVFGEDGTLRFVVASRAHHAELGGIVPGSMPPFSKTLADEGVLIRNLRVVRDGVFQEAELRDILTSAPYPSRRPDDNVADVTAQIAANQTGVERLAELVSAHSLTTVQRYMRFIREAAASKVRHALTSLPDGEYRNTDFLDDGTPISVTITIAGESARVDFTGTGPVLATNLNANRAIVTAAVLYVFRTLIDEEIPLNGGVLQPVTIVLPECLLKPAAHDDPAHCAAIVGGNVETSQRVVDVLLGALKLAAASQGTMNNLTFGDATFGYYETICGGSGATPHAGGADAVQVHMTNTRLTDVELMEHRYPVLVHKFAIRRGSGGAGQRQGGCGIIREIEFLRPVTASILSQRRGPYPPPGLHGGQPGQLGRNALIRASGDESDLGAAAQVSIQAGDRLRIETPGGGGWGNSIAETPNRSGIP
jgi:5-oxoprolinase (ATP-hydrolysing)